MANGDGHGFRALEQSSALTVAARVLMVVASVIVLPIGSWVLIRSVTQGETLVKLDERLETAEGVSQDLQASQAALNKAQAELANTTSRALAVYEVNESQKDAMLAEIKARLDRLERRVLWHERDGTEPPVR